MASVRSSVSYPSLRQSLRESSGRFGENCASTRASSSPFPRKNSLVHAQQAGSLAGKHRDPFDRMLIAQAQTEGLMLVTNETLFEAYGVRRLW